MTFTNLSLKKYFPRYTESTLYLRLRSNFFAERNTHLNKITNIDSNNLNQVDATAIKTLLFGHSKYHNAMNMVILNASIDFIQTPKKLGEAVLDS